MLKRVYIATVFLWLLTFVQIATGQPPQRIIIVFTHTLSAEECAEITAQLDTLLNKKYNRESHSNNYRWIISLSAHKQKEELAALIKKLRQHQLIKNVEHDQLLRPEKHFSNQ